jgi:hypothetical protein
MCSDRDTGNLAQRKVPSVVRFLRAKENSPVETDCQLLQARGDGVMRVQQARR